MLSVGEGKGQICTEKAGGRKYCGHRTLGEPVEQNCSCTFFYRHAASKKSQRIFHFVQGAHSAVNARLHTVNCQSAHLPND